MCQIKATVLIHMFNKKKKKKWRWWR